MRRADRLFHLVGVLRNRRFATADQLAEALEVSKRTVYRDIRDLQLSGIPVLGEAGVGYHLQRGFELPPLMFNVAEMEALVLGARVVETWGDPELAEAVRTAMAKVAQVVPDGLRQRLFDTPLFAPEGRGSRLQTGGFLAPIRRAVTDRQKVRIGYTRADGEVSKRIIRPLALYFWGATWSLAAWCELRRAYRNFRPDRMQEAELLDERFDPADGPSLKGFLAEMEERSQREGYNDEVRRTGPTSST